jgi:hypothetical protein
MKTSNAKRSRPSLSPEAREISKRALLKLVQKVLRNSLKFRPHPKRRRTRIKR